MFVLFFFIPYFHPLFSCFSSGLVVVIRVKESENSDSKLKESETIQNIIGGVDKETGEYQGIEAFLSSESIVHIAPRILTAPQFTHHLPEIDGVNPVVTALISIAEKLRAIIVAKEI